MLNYEGLIADELAYELLIRGENRVDFTLRQARRQLESIEDTLRVQLILKAEGELVTCKTKLQILKDSVENFVGGEENPEYTRLDNRIAQSIETQLAD